MARFVSQRCTSVPSFSSIDVFLVKFAIFYSFVFTCDPTPREVKKTKSLGNINVVRTVRLGNTLDGRTVPRAGLSYTRTVRTTFMFPKDLDKLGLGLVLELVGVSLENISFLLFVSSFYIANFRLIRAIIKKLV